MFDFSFSEIALLVIVSMVFIRPKDLPVALRTVAGWIKAMRRMAAEFQSHVDEMVREADLSETRDQFRELRRFNLRDQVARAIDSDESIRKGLALDEVSVSRPYAPLAPPETTSPEAEQSEAEEAAGAEEARAPRFLPPAHARRLVAERPRWGACAVLPPVVALHHGRRVTISRPDEPCAEERS